MGQTVFVRRHDVGAKLVFALERLRPQNNYLANP